MIQPLFRRDCHHVAILPMGFLYRLEMLSGPDVRKRLATNNETLLRVTLQGYLARIGA